MGHMACMGGGKRHACRVSLGGGGGGFERKRPLGRPRRRWKDNSELDREEIE